MIYKKENINTKNKPGQDNHRFKKTLVFVKDKIKSKKVLDIGESNPLGYFLKKALKLDLTNTTTDLDYSIDAVGFYDTIFCFEIIEHLLNPRCFFDNLYKCTTKNVQVFLSYPARPKIFWNKEIHFHEYDKRRFEYLLKVTNWEIVEHGKIFMLLKRWWMYLTGIRPFLRLFINFTQIYELKKRK